MSNFEILRETIAKNAHALVLTGENRYEIYEKLKSFSKDICIESDFDSAVKKGFLLTKNNCALVFSPASVSYDAFSNFEERGEAFKRVAQEIKMTYFNGKV